jgi:uncharacterized OB-fold protein
MVAYLRLDGEPTLVAQVCESCGARFLDRRNGCAHCGATLFRSESLARRGLVRSYTIVHRSAPGVQTPFVSAVVGLEDGAVVKATLREVEPEMKMLAAAMPVELVTFVAGTDADGVEAVGFGFRPVPPAEGAPEGARRAG